MQDLFGMINILLKSLGLQGTGNELGSDKFECFYRSVILVIEALTSCSLLKEAVVVTSVHFSDAPSIPLKIYFYFLMV